MRGIFVPDLLSLANSFATVVSLLGLFKQERRADQHQSKEEFVQWLDEHRHHEIRDLIIGSQDLMAGIETALQENHDVILAKLNKIDEILVSLFSQVQGFSGISLALHPNAGLSDQAISILRQLVNSSANELIEHRRGDGFISLRLNPGNILETPESRLVGSDLDILVSLNLLMSKTTSTGLRIFRITRNADKFLEIIDGEVWQSKSS
jgi:hypothetical protein